MEDKKQQLFDLISCDYSQNQVERIKEGLKQRIKTTFRVNTLKANTEIVERELTLNEIEYQQDNIIHFAYHIENKYFEKLKTLDIYKNGAIYVQNISSMLPSICLGGCKKQDVLDMCASPGGKTSLICALNENESHLMACEINKQRYERLKYNLDKLGCKNINFMQINTLQLDDFYRFDKILLDAPCSGSGTLNLNETKSYNKFSLELVNRCENMQVKLLKKALSLLKKGESMIYSTCSILKIENENVVKQFVDGKKYQLQAIDFIQNNFSDNLLSSSLENTYTICPSDLMEGFFICKIKKVA